MAAPISVCVPAYNAATTLEETMRSILVQDYEGELLVVDNASNDATNLIANSFKDSRVRVLNNEGFLSIGDNWNKTVNSARFELVKVVCADDIISPASLRLQAEVMADPNVAVCSSRFNVIDTQSVVIESSLGLPGLLGFHSAREVASVIVRRGPADFGPTAAALFRRSQFIQVGGFQGDYPFTMDVHLFARAAACGVFFGMSTVTAAWRSSNFNLCSQTSTISKLNDMFRSQHRLAKQHPEMVSCLDVVAGDLRLLRTAFARLGIRTRSEIQSRFMGPGPGTEQCVDGMTTTGPVPSSDAHPPWQSA